MPLNPDLNSGNPIGIGIAPATSFNGYRSTSEFLAKGRVPENLIIATDAQAVKILLEGKKAIGVQLKDGRKRKCPNLSLSPTPC